MHQTPSLAATVAAKIRAGMNTAAINYTRLADLTGRPRQTLRLHLQHGRNLTIEEAEECAAIVGLNLGQLFEPVDAEDVAS